MQCYCKRGWSVFEFNWSQLNLSLEIKCSIQESFEFFLFSCSRPISTIISVLRKSYILLLHRHRYYLCFIATAQWQTHINMSKYTNRDTKKLISRDMRKVGFCCLFPDVIVILAMKSNRFLLVYCYSSVWCMCVHRRNPWKCSVHEIERGNGHFIGDARRNKIYQSDRRQYYL